MCKPLFELTQKGVKFEWGVTQVKAMQTMKDLLTSAPILGYPRPEGRFILDTDASNIGLGAVLHQEQAGQEVVIAYASKTLSKAERNYCVTRRELLAIITFVKQYHHYLYGSRFLVRTDHAALYWLLRKKDPEGQMARWITFLQQYDMKIQHRPGARHQDADALSRCMEGCRDLDTLELAEGQEATLAEIQQLAQETVFRVQTRAESKARQCEDPSDLVPIPQVRESQPNSQSIQSHNPPTQTAPCSEPKDRSPKAGPDLPSGAHAASPPFDSGKATSHNSGGVSDFPEQREASQYGQFPSSMDLDPAAEATCPGPPDAENLSVPLLMQDPRELARADRAPGRVGNTARSSPRSRDSDIGILEEQNSRPQATASGGVRDDTPTTTHSRQGCRPAKRVPVDEPPPDSRLQFFQEQLAESWSDEAMCYLQNLDRDLSTVKSWFREKHHPTWEEVAKENHVVKAWWYRAEQLWLSENGILYIRWQGAKASDPPTFKVVAVSTMFKAILAQLHDAKTAGHLGQKKTIHRVKHSRFYWPGMTAFARRWVSVCTVCASRKSPKFSKRVPMQVYRVGSPMDRVSLDLLGPFKPKTSRLGSTLILTLTDHWTR